jgi:hypothetical protein
MGFFQSLFNKEKSKKEILAPNNAALVSHSNNSASPPAVYTNHSTEVIPDGQHRRGSSIHSISSHHILPATSPLALSPQLSNTPSAIASSTKTPTPPLSQRPSTELTRRFVMLEDGTHIHHLMQPAQNRIAASLNGLVTGLAHKSLRLTQWTERKVSMEDILKERAALNLRLHRSNEPQQTLAEKWGTCHETIGKGTSGVVRVAHKIDVAGERLYAVKVNASYRKTAHCISNIHTIAL